MTYSKEHDFIWSAGPLEIQYHRRLGAFNMPVKHFHDTYEIYYLVSGERYYFIKDRTYHIFSGDIVLINKNVLHKTMVAGAPAHERILINFTGEYLQSLTGTDPEINPFACFKLANNLVRLGNYEQNRLRNLLFKILEECKNKAPGYMTYLKLSLAEILILLNRYMKKSRLPREEPENPTQKKIFEIVRYINQNYMTDISLKILAERFYLSSYYLSRTFKKVTGFSFVEYLNNVRVKEAQKLLCESDYNVTKIAELVGFYSLTHFGRVFKTITGYPPLKYRKAKKAQESI